MPRTMAVIAAFASAIAVAASADDEKVVAQLDLDYQAAVKRNDADAMAKILADDMILVTGRGTVYTRKDLLDGERDFDYQLWFSDTYVRIDGRWRYAFGQASIPL